ncbi:MAG: hypothetical protein VW339_01115 [Quisquiliibacterium sp.]
MLTERKGCHEPVALEPTLASSGFFGACLVGLRVQWLSESVLATRRTQCNNASLRHVGGATYGALTSVFDRITCVERVISCSGAGCR